MDTIFGNPSKYFGIKEDFPRLLFDWLSEKTRELLLQVEFK